MPMKMGWRWYGQGNDPVSLADIKQIPGVTSIVWALHHKMPGEIWEEAEIKEVVDQIHEYGFDAEVVESVNVHDDIKIGLPSRDALIENYKVCIRNLAKFGVKVICYNFMPVFDWTRTDLAMDMGNGATCLCYFGEQIEGKSPEDMFREIDDNSNGYAMPGWETERMGEIKELFEKYKNVTAEDLWNNLKYFLEKIIPVCEECDVKMAIHPDDPPWDIFGLPRIIKDIDSLKRLLSLVDSPCNGLTFCTGSLGASEKNDLPKMIREVGDRIYFAHLRNVKVVGNRFNETSHLSSDGSLDMYEIVKALQDVCFDGYIRPDHGRQLWEEGPGSCRPGYGKYDRALGVQYMLGVWDLLDRLAEEKK